MCRLGVGKLLRMSLIHVVWYFGPLLSKQEIPVWVTGAVSDVQGKDGEKHLIHSALNPSFVAESTVGSR